MGVFIGLDVGVAVARRRGMKRATVAVARKLAVIMDRFTNLMRPGATAT
jgi:hypothetical protein